MTNIDRSFLINEAWKMFCTDYMVRKYPDAEERLEQSLAFVEQHFCAGLYENAD